MKPIAEGAYEAGSEYGFEVTPLWIRRQAYYSYLAGGHHTYGHNDSWRVLPTFTTPAGWVDALLILEADGPGPCLLLQKGAPSAEVNGAYPAADLRPL